jgi:hypothetical protein
MSITDLTQSQEDFIVSSLVNGASINQIRNMCSNNMCNENGKAIIKFLNNQKPEDLELMEKIFSMIR